MHAALAALSTTLAGAGHGLVAWSGLSIALLALRGGLSPALDGVQLAGFGLGLLLSIAGLPGLLAGPAPDALGHRTAARPLARRALASAASLPTLAAMALLLWMAPGADRAAWLACLGLLATASALAALGGVAMDDTREQSSNASPRRPGPLGFAVHLLSALLCGLALQLVAMAAMLRGQGPAGLLPVLMLAGLGLSVLLWLHWRAIEVAHRADAPKSTRGLTGPGSRLRLTALAGPVLGPLLGALLVLTGWLAPLPATLVAATGLLGAAFSERLLASAALPRSTGTAA